MHARDAILGRIIEKSRAYSTQRKVTFLIARKDKGLAISGSVLVIFMREFENIARVVTDDDLLQAGVCPALVAIFTTLSLDKSNTEGIPEELVMVMAAAVMGVMLATSEHYIEETYR